MATKDEALKMAIEAMDCYDYTGYRSENELYTKAIQACKEALEQPSVAQLNDEYLRDTHVAGLEQPAQDYGDWFPIGLDAETGNCNHDRYAEGWNDCLNECWEAYDRYKNCPIEQPAQEPVALKFPTMLRKMWSGGEVQEWLDKQQSLYTHPAPSWEGLTDDEIGKICKEAHNHPENNMVLWAINETIKRIKDNV